LKFDVNKQAGRGTARQAPARHGKKGFRLAVKGEWKWL
jgi:hypothetical protein